MRSTTPARLRMCAGFSTGPALHWIDVTRLGNERPFLVPIEPQAERVEDDCRVRGESNAGATE